MKYMNKSMMLVASGMLALVSCTEYSDYNSVPEDSNPLANKTLMENISENEQLQDFATIINKAGCSEILNTSRVFTLWAPADGTYDATPYLNMDSANVMDKFIKQHLAEYSYQVVGEVNSRVATMNLKHHDFTNTNFDDAEIKAVNIPASNGIMHILNGVSEYHPNLYEYLDIVEGCDSFADYIHQYDIYTIDKTKSVIGPMVNGQQTYKDTVWTKTNSAMRTILHADLENEDSTYTLLLPTNAAWKKAKEQMSASYNYITDFNYLDLSKLSVLISSLQKKTDIPNMGNSDKKIDVDPVFLKDTLMNTHILRNLVYSNTDERNKPILSGVVTETDTLFSTSSRKVTSIQNFIDNTIGDLAEMSNGYVRHLSDIGYYPWESYEPILRFNRPGRVYGTIDGVEKGKEVQVLQTKVTDEMWGDEFDGGNLDFLKIWLMPKSSSYLTYYGTDATMISDVAFVEMDYYLKGAMATKYRVYVVTVPESLNDPELVNKKALRTFAFSTHSYDGTSVTSTMGFYNKGTADPFSNGTFKSDSSVKDYTDVDNSKIHAMEFDIDVPICYSNTDAAPVLFIQSFATGRQNQYKNFDRNLRIAGVFCVPYSALDYVKKLKYEK